MRDVRAAALQFECRDGDKDANFETLERLAGTPPAAGPRSSSLPSAA